MLDSRLLQMIFRLPPRRLAWDIGETYAELFESLFLCRSMLFLSSLLLQSCPFCPRCTPRSPRSSHPGCCTVVWCKMRFECSNTREVRLDTILCLPIPSPFTYIYIYIYSESNEKLSSSSIQTCLLHKQFGGTW